MKNLILILIIFQVFQTSAQQQKHPIDVKNNKCLEEAVPTTIGSIICEKEALKAWESEMETILKLLKENQKLLNIKLLEETQTKWLAFHKKQVQFYYSYYQTQYQGGTMARAAALSHDKRYLRERVIYLKELYEEISGQ